MKSLCDTCAKRHMVSDGCSQRPKCDYIARQIFRPDDGVKAYVFVHTCPDYRKEEK